MTMHDYHPDLNHNDHDPSTSINGNNVNATATNDIDDVTIKLLLALSHSVEVVMIAIQPFVTTMPRLHGIYKISPGRKYRLHSIYKISPGRKYNTVYTKSAQEVQVTRYIQSWPRKYRLHSIYTVSQGSAVRDIYASLEKDHAPGMWFFLSTVLLHWCSPSVFTCVSIGCPVWIALREQERISCGTDWVGEVCTCGLLWPLTMEVEGTMC